MKQLNILFALAFLLRPPRQKTWEKKVIKGGTRFWISSIIPPTIKLMWNLILTSLSFFLEQGGIVEEIRFFIKNLTQNINMNNTRDPKVFCYYIERILLLNEKISFFLPYENFSVTMHL